MVRSYTDGRIKLIEGERFANPEVVKAHLIPKVTTAYVAFLDSDDWYLPHKLAEQCNFLSQNPEFMALCCWGQLWHSQSNEMMLSSLAQGILTPEHFFKRQGMPHQQGWLYRREVFSDLPLLAFWGSDAVYMLSLLLRYPGRVYQLPQTLWVYRVHEESSVNSTDLNALQRHIQSLFQDAYPVMDNLLKTAPEYYPDFYHYVALSLRAIFRRALLGGHGGVLRELLHSLPQEYPAVFNVNQGVFRLYGLLSLLPVGLVRWAYLQKRRLGKLKRRFKQFC